MNATIELHPLSYIGLLLFASYAGGRAASALKMPRVVGYLVMGMLLSPSGLGLLQEHLIKEDLALITDIALAMIAFSIGGSLGLGNLQRLGRHILWITLAQALGAFCVVTLVLAALWPLMLDANATSLTFWSLHFPMALVIGAICAATAPAAILAIIHEYRAQGTLTTILLGVVALDDGLTILFYAFAASIAGSLMHHDAITWQKALLSPSMSILLSVLIGGVMGGCLHSLIRFVSRREAMLGIMLGCVFLVSGLAISLQVSPLLANMGFGFIVANFIEHHDDLFVVVERIEEPIFGMFFALAGAHLDLQAMQAAGGLVLLITLGRFAGKLSGSYLGARLSHAPTLIKKYLGLALLPTAGVTVGLILEARDIFATNPLANVMVNGVLGSVILNELLTPFFVRHALSKAGEMRQT